MNIGGGGQTSKAMSALSSSVSWGAVDGISDKFPAGLRVLVVDDDPTCLRILEKMLRTCLYEVTKCNRAEVALSYLRENRNGYDIVISDVHMPDMDGFQLLVHVGIEMDLPVIMMSADDSKDVVMKGVKHGACDYLIKPVRIEALKNIWQHVVRKRKCEWKDKEFEQAGIVEDGDRHQKPSEDFDCSSSANEDNWKNTKKRKDEGEEIEEREDTSTLKKPRVVWSVELHQQFVVAVNQLGIDKAVPKRILELMDVPGLTRENVASHLQKYRLYLRRLGGESQHQTVLNNSFMGTPEPGFGSISSLNGLDLQALAGSGQLPVQSLATLQVAALGKSTSKSGMPMPVFDQRNVFSFGTPQLSFGEGQLQLNNSNKQMNLLHGIPTSVEPKQLSNLHPAQPLLGVNINSEVNQSSPVLMQMPRPLSRVQLVDDTTGSQVVTSQSSIGRTILSNSIPGGVLAPKSALENTCGTVYNAVSGTSPMVDFTMNQNTGLPGNRFPLLSHSGMSSFTSNSMLQEEFNSEVKGSRSSSLGCDLFSEQPQHIPQHWGLQNVNSSFDVSSQSSIQGTMDFPQSILVQQQFPSCQRSGQCTSIPVGKTAFSGVEGGQYTSSNMGQQVNSDLMDISFRAKTEGLPDSNNQSSFFPEDLTSAFLKQPQEGDEPADERFCFDGYSLDSLPV